MLTDLDPPEWFTSALDQVAEVGEASVAGASIQYRARGPSGAAGVVLVHGGAAHSHW
jgi:S-adenosylmethionine/arginine decarboxylase-like enzyme